MIPILWLIVAASAWALPNDEPPITHADSTRIEAGQRNLLRIVAYLERYYQQRSCYPERLSAREVAASEGSPAHPLLMTCFSDFDYRPSADCSQLCTIVVRYRGTNVWQTWDSRFGLRRLTLVEPASLG